MGFSRHQINSQIIMPERAVLRPGASRDEILEHYSAQGKLPRPFAPMVKAEPELDADAYSPSPSPFPLATPLQYSPMSEHFRSLEFM